METRTIPEDQWSDFLNDFNRENAMRTVSIQIFSQTHWPRLVAENLPFQGISFDTKGTRSSAVHISAGDTPETHMSHVIDMPLYIRQADEPDGAIDLHIEPAEGGTTTLIRIAGPPN
jgi:hypothetical protein